MSPEHPSRGARAQYDRYLAGMDASMKQKVALTAAHFLCAGRIADLGMGSGAGSHALAALYPELQVVGVDLDPMMVALAAEKYRLPNLRFDRGDAAAPGFADGSLDGILDSSILHHVTTFGGYRHAAAGAALAAQVRCLKPHGVLVVRDFVAPPAGEVLLDLPTGDGDESFDPLTCSSAALFRRFAGEFRALHAAPGFPLEELGGGPPGHARFRVSRRHAVEFLLRKDYRTDWAAEVKEEYTYATQDEAEALFARLGLRVLASTPLVNPWIARHRLDGRYRWQTSGGAPLEHPATNYVIAGERVPPGEGVGFRVAGPAAPLGFLVLDHHARKDTGAIFDLVRRPHPTVDVIPWFARGGELFVVARMSYPRPLLALWQDGAPTLDGCRPPHYVTEPLNVLEDELPLGLTVEAALAEAAGIAADAIVGFHPGSTYYPSPGGVLEEVRSTLVEVTPLVVEDRIVNRSGLSTAGRVRAIAAQQVLRAAQVGGLSDARLELNAYDLILARGPVGAWIGEELALGAVAAPAPTALAACLARPPRRRFARARRAESSGFLQLGCARFEELGADGAVVAARPFEWVAPRTLSRNTIAIALLARAGDEVLLAVDDDDLPAAQSFAGTSQLLVAPAWRLPRAITTVSPARAFVRERCGREYGLALGELATLGGPYHPSAGLTPEVVYPLAASVTATGPAERALAWIPLRELVAGRAALRDGHLRVVMMRAAHALGLFGA